MQLHLAGTPFERLPVESPTWCTMGPIRKSEMEIPGTIYRNRDPKMQILA